MTIKIIIQTMLERIKNYIDLKFQEVDSKIGTLSNLATSNKNNLVEAINETKTKWQ